MNTRVLGRTGLRVSEVGFGAWGISGRQWIGASDEESVRALRIAIERGVNFIDTALAYGDGHSEVLVGRVAREHRGKVLVATKIPPKNRLWPARSGIPVEEVFPGEHVTACTEESLRNLGLDAVDLQQLHVWHDEFTGRGDWLSAVERLKRQGKIRFFGVSLGEHTPENGLRLLETGVVDAVQVIYNIFDQSPEDRLFPACRRLNVGVLVRVPFDEGGLTGKITPETRFPEGDFRNHYFRGDRRRQVHERCLRIAADLGIGLDGLPEAALRFCLSRPEVSTVIAGMRSVRHVDSNVAAGDGRGLSPDRLEKLRAHRWVRNFYE